MERAEAARRIVEAITALFFSTENQARFHETADELRLQPPVLKALLDLEPGQGLPMRQLADRWGCDASFVTVVCDSLEAEGYAERRVAPHDRRIKTVELTDAGISAQEWARGVVYGPRAGFAALTDDEQVTLATLLDKLARAQTAHDEALSAGSAGRVAGRRPAATRARGRRGRAEGAGGWREHFEAQRQEIRTLKEELARVSAELVAQARRPVDEAKAAKAEIKAAARRPVDDAKAEIKAAKAEIKAEAKARARRAVGADGGDRDQGGPGSGRRRR